MDKIKDPQQGSYDRLLLVNGEAAQGPWKLTIQNGGQLRGFVNDEGDFVPEAAVAIAKRLPINQ